MTHREDGLHAVEHGLELDAQGVAELGDHDVGRDGEDRLDDLGLAPMGVDPLPELGRNPVRVLADLDREVDEGALALGVVAVAKQVVAALEK